MSQTDSSEKSKADDQKNNGAALDLPETVEVLESKALNALFTVIRNKETSNEHYVFYCDRLCRILAEEGLAIFSEANDNSHLISIETPCGPYNGMKCISSKDLCIVSIVRSGDILLEAVRKICPGAAIGKILLQRVESSKDKHPIHLYTKLPKNIDKLKVMLVDPMLATGGSAIGAMKILTNVELFIVSCLVSCLIDNRQWYTLDIGTLFILSFCFVLFCFVFTLFSMVSRKKI